MANACGVETSTGVVLFYKDPLDDTFKSIGGVTELPQLSFTHATSSCDDTGGGWATNYKNGKLTNNPTSVTYNWKPADAMQEKMWAAFIATDIDTFRIVWSDTGATQVDFDANVTSFDVPTPSPDADDNKIVRTIGLTPSGAPTWA